MESRAAHYGNLSRQIWELAEVGYKEVKSSALLREQLRTAGFTIAEGVGGMPTAFTASWGQGKPVIAILGEFDALPGLSQDDVPEKRPRPGVDAGHGCGHNLFGAASAFAAITVKEQLEAAKMPGTIRFYGTPAEEGGGGKIYMARAGVFRDVDIALAWHPGSVNAASNGTTMANISAKFRFRGTASHAAAAPQAGRSALDAVMIMTHAVDLLREHVPEDTRLHYIISNGGSAPNIVPDFAEVFIYARQPSMPVLDSVWERIVKCAQAGALATGTRMESEVVNSVYNMLPNDRLAALFDHHLRSLGGIKYSAAERAFAEQLRQTFQAEAGLSLGSEETIQPVRTAAGAASTDLADVSWIVPTGEFVTATYVPGTPGHSWQSTACAGMSIGRKGMLLAAKTLALAALDIFHNPAIATEARASFDKRRAGHVYRSRIPDNQPPPLNYRDKE